MSNDEKITHILTAVSNIEHMQSDMNRSIHCFESSMKSVCGRLDSVVSRVDVHSKLLKLIAYKSIDSEARSRRNNILFRGFVERVNEDCREVIASFLDVKIRLDSPNIPIARAHRLGRPRHNYSRPIMWHSLNTRTLS